jgi:hypothetical protein
MPATVSGQYYLILISDAFDNLNEQDETNNFMYVGDQIFEIQGGEILGAVGKNNPGVFGALMSYAPTRGQRPLYASVRSAQNPNTYTPTEIRGMLQDRLRSGDLARKVREFHASQARLGRPAMQRARAAANYSNR